ncbi:hypothetical protein B0H16DRAFT_1507687 [Mycena metata]|uniref:Uncharacterized protein n=1 Tax=Mycena metata TaxID=1033252 RepID=A0AAD7K2H1_9AGAR|nr:hypothetical protein B0H16DRAFT_1507687 [Mycena metata]
MALPRFRRWLARGAYFLPLNFEWAFSGTNCPSLSFDILLDLFPSILIHLLSATSSSYFWHILSMSVPTLSLSLSPTPFPQNIPYSFLCLVT